MRSSVMTFDKLNFPKYPPPLGPPKGLKYYPRCIALMIIHTYFTLEENCRSRLLSENDTEAK